MISGWAFNDPKDNANITPTLPEWETPVTSGLLGESPFNTPTPTSWENGYQSAVDRFANPQVLSKTDNTSSSTIDRIAFNELIPVALGYVQFSAKFCFGWGKRQKVYTLFNLCVGEIDAIEKIIINGEALPASRYHTRLGSLIQTPIDLITDTLDGNYADDFIDSDFNIGIAHALIEFGSDDSYSVPIIQARGLKVYDPATDSVIYTDNAVLLAAAFWTNPVWGCGFPLDWNSVIDAAAAWDQRTLGEPGKRFGLVMDSSSSISDWLATFETYTNVRFTKAGNTFRCVDERAPVSVAYHFSHSSGDIVERSPLSVDVISDSRLPTRVEGTFTDDSETVWKVAPTDSVSLPGVELLTRPYRSTRLSLHGFHDNRESMRVITTKINWRQRSYRLTLEVKDVGILLQVGDLITITHPIGLSEALMQVISTPEVIDNGLVRLTLLLFVPDIYDSPVVDKITYPGINVVSAFDKRALASLTISEHFVTLPNGTKTSKLRYEWTLPNDWSYAGFVNFKVTLGGIVIDESTNIPANSLVAYSGDVLNPILATRFANDYDVFRPVTVLNQNSVMVTATLYSVLGYPGEPLNKTFTILGPTKKPPVVENINVRIFDNDLLFTWSPVSDLDLAGYEIRRALPWYGWDDPTTIVEDFTAGNNSIIAIPPISGQSVTYDYLFMARDSGGRYSEEPGRLRVTIEAKDTGFVSLEKFAFGATPNTWRYKIGAVDHMVAYNAADTYNAASSVWQRAASNPDTPVFRLLRGSGTIETIAVPLIDSGLQRVAWRFPIDTDGDANLIATKDGIETIYPSQTLLGRQADKVFIDADDVKMRITGYNYFHFSFNDPSHVISIYREWRSKAMSGSGGPGLFVFNIGITFSSVITLLITPNSDSEVLRITTDSSDIENGNITIGFFNAAGGTVFSTFSLYIEGY